MENRKLENRDGNKMVVGRLQDLAAFSIKKGDLGRN